MLTIRMYKLLEHNQGVSTTVLLFYSDLISGVKSLIVQMEITTKIMHGHLTEGLNTLLVLHCRFHSMQHKRSLQVSSLYPVYTVHYDDYLQIQGLLFKLIALH